MTVNNKLLKTLGRRLKTRREQQLLSPEIVASKLKIPTNSYLEWEDGKVKPPIKKLNEVSHILRSHTDTLTFGLELE